MPKEFKIDKIFTFIILTRAGEVFNGRCCMIPGLQFVNQKTNIENDYF